MKIFWSWQSDIPGKTGRFFIRDALNAAIKELQQPEHVEEPIERDVKDAMHLDHDRQGVTGSPRLLDLILKKIDASAVFVADVTPVAKIPAKKVGEEWRPAKRIMNPNVAIELGYALKSLSDLNVLMVLNAHYGGREFLPFDIAGNAGPIIFKLPPDADSQQIKEVGRKLKNDFVVALRGFVTVAAAPAVTFVQTPTTTSRAVFFQPGDILATFGEPRDNERFRFANDKGVYLRLIPRVGKARPFTKVELKKVVENIGRLDALSSNDSSYSITVNDYGVAASEIGSHSGKTLKSCTQLFANGELWGFAPWLVTDKGFGPIIAMPALENVVRRALPRYLQVAKVLGFDPPFDIQLGAVGINGFELLINENQDSNLGPIVDDEVSGVVTLNDLSTSAQNAALLALFEKFFSISGYPRPKNFNGFPT